MIVGLILGKISSLRHRAYLITIIVFLLAGCQNGEIPLEDSNKPTEAAAPAIVPEVTVTSEGEPYPGPGTEPSQQQGYPGPIDSRAGAYQSNPPDPVRELPEAIAENGVIGGVLIEEVQGKGYVALLPLKLLLGKVLLSDSGESSYIRTGVDSVKAELSPSGIFIFQSVEPGVYGMVVDLGFTSFTIDGDDGAPLLITVEPGTVLDLGQVITRMPGS